MPYGAWGFFLSEQHGQPLAAGLFRPVRDAGDRRGADLPGAVFLNGVELQRICWLVRCHPLQDTQWYSRVSKRLLLPIRALWSVLTSASSAACRLG